MNKQGKAWNRSSSVSWPACAAASLSLIGKSLTAWIAREACQALFVEDGLGYTLSNGEPLVKQISRTDCQASSRLTKKTTAKPNQHARRRRSEEV